MNYNVYHIPDIDSYLEAKDTNYISVCITLM